jgi:predicted nucleic acid-binding protein
MFDSYEVVTDEEDTLDGQIEESDYAAIEAGSMPKLEFQSKVNNALARKTKVVQEVAELTAAEEAQQRELQNMEVLSQSWEDKLNRHRRILEKRLVPDPDDAKALRVAEEGAADASLAWEKAQKDFAVVQRSKERKQAELIDIQNLEAVSIDRVLSINLGDGLARYPHVMAQASSQLITALRHELISVEDYQLNPASERAQIKRNELLQYGDAHPLSSSFHEMLTVLEGEVDAAEMEIYLLRELETAYLLIYTHYFGLIEDPQKKKFVWQPREVEVMRLERQEKAAARLEKQLDEKKEALRQRAKLLGRTPKPA